MNDKTSKNNYINLYIIILFIFSIFYLHQKHLVGNDSTISEWLINYEGGFTKRGLIGQTAIYISYLFDLSLRSSILFLQIVMIGIYHLLLLIFLKNLKLNKLILLSVFSPIFILYPVAEIEVLGRKEIFIFSFFIIYLFLKNNYQKILYKIILLPLLMLIWEPVIFFFIFWFILDYIENINKNIKYNLTKSLLTYLPAVLIGFLIALNPISEINHNKMAIFLKENFNENCYMSCALLLSKSSIHDQFSANLNVYSFEVFIRYILIVLVGFGPLIILTKYSKFERLNNLTIVLLIVPPIIVLFSMMSDWGRIVNISYTFSLLSYLHLYQKKLLVIDKTIEDNYLLKIFNNKKLFVIFFIIFSFGWNPKTSLAGDIATNPLWKIPYNASKRIIGFDSFRILQESPLSIWHKKLIE